MVNDKKDLMSVTLLDEQQRNPVVCLIPRFTRPPQWIRRHNKTYLRSSPAVYVEAFGWTIGFQKETDA